MNWLTRPVLAGGFLVAKPLDPTRLSDSDLWDVCRRMHAILSSVEDQRCEGRLLPADLFDDIDSFAHRLLHPRLETSQPETWGELIRKFGEHYELAGDGAIDIDPVAWRAAVSWLKQRPVGDER